MRLAVPNSQKGSRLTVYLFSGNASNARANANEKPPSAPNIALCLICCLLRARVRCAGHAPRSRLHSARTHLRHKAALGAPGSGGLRGWGPTFPIRSSRLALRCARAARVRARASRCGRRLRAGGVGLARRAPGFAAVTTLAHSAASRALADCSHAERLRRARLGSASASHDERGAGQRLRPARPPPGLAGARPVPPRLARCGCPAGPRKKRTRLFPC